MEIDEPYVIQVVTPLCVEPSSTLWEVTTVTMRPGAVHRLERNSMVHSHLQACIPPSTRSLRMECVHVLAAHCCCRHSVAVWTGRPWGSMIGTITRCGFRIKLTLALC